jgi:cell wall assembly regulator SMI1
MNPIPEVVEARALMTEGMDWSVMKWLSEKKRVRKAADKANATLDRVEQELHDAWPQDLKAAYEQLEGKPGNKPSAELERLAKTIKETHDAAIRGRMDAEETFDKAERRLSANLAREGCHKAIAGWDLHEEAIRKAEAAIARK